MLRSKATLIPIQVADLDLFQKVEYEMFLGLEDSQMK